jgi:hypothetical protein
MRLCLAICLMAGLGGCAGLTDFVCARTDALALGERLARQGEPEAALSREAGRCAGTPTPLRTDLLAAGHARGRAIHCTRAGAFEAGRDGYRLGAFCPSADYPALRTAFRRGVLLAEVEAELRALEVERSQLVERIRALAEEDPERRALRHAIRRLDRRSETLDARRFLLRAGAI